jgi:predicted dehydrogenase
MSNNKPLKLGFIGGSIESAVGNTHKIASQMDSRFSLEAGCFSRFDEINKKTAKMWDVDAKRVYKDYLELLKNEKDRLDAVVILTPTPLHHKMVIDALSYGYAVICEKSLAITSYEGESICRALEKSNGFLAVTHNYTGYPMVREIRDLISRGSLGKIHQIQIQMPQESFVRVDKHNEKLLPQTWRLRDGKVPSISLDLGAHLHHLVYFFSSKNPLFVVGEQNSFGWFKDIVDDVMSLARYADGLRSQMWYSKVALGDRNGLQIRMYGNKGSIHWYQMQPEEIKLYKADGTYLIIDRASDVNVANEARYNRFKAGHPAGFIEAFANLYFDFADELIEYKKTGRYDMNWIYGPKQATKGLYISEAIKKSSDENRWVKL